MNNRIKQAKQFVMKSFPRNSQVNDCIDFRYVSFSTEALQYRDVLPEVLSELVMEGFLTSENRLTEKGFTYLFPSDVESLKKKFFHFLNNCNIRIGDIVNTQLLQFNFLVHLNTQDREDFFNTVLPDLLANQYLKERNKQLHVVKLG